MKRMEDATPRNPHELLHRNSLLQHKMCIQTLDLSKRISPLKVIEVMMKRMEDATRNPHEILHQNSIIQHKMLIQVLQLSKPLNAIDGPRCRIKHLTPDG